MIINIDKPVGWTSFDIVKKGSEILIEEFPSNEDLIDTKDKIEKI